METKYQRKLRLYQIIRWRMVYLKKLLDKNCLPPFAASEAKFDLDELKRKYPHCWKTRNRRYKISKSKR